MRTGPDGKNQSRSAGNYPFDRRNVERVRRGHFAGEVVVDPPRQARTRNGHHAPGYSARWVAGP